MLTPKEAFKVGFLARCVSDGLSPDQMLSSVKRANDMLEKKAFLGEQILGKGFDAARDVVGATARYGIPLALAAPPVLGGLGGYALAKGTDIDDTDVDAIKNKELIDEYKRQAEKLKRQRAIRNYREDVKRTGRVFM